MKKLLNTLYVTTEGAALKKDGENLVAEVEGEERARAPLHLIEAVVTFGPVLITPSLIAACASRGSAITLLDRNGRFQARVEGPTNGNVLLRREQYRMSEKPSEIVRSVVAAKIANQRAVLLRALRDGDEDAAARPEIEAAAVYFRVFGRLVRSPDADIAFRGRSRRPPLDPVNALLSFVYTLFTHDCRSAAESVGLDPAVGFLHRERPGRPSLALDLMEELRAPLADRLCLSLINRRQIRSRDFRVLDDGAVLLGDEGRKSVLVAWQERERDERTHPFLGESAPLGLVPFV